MQRSPVWPGLMLATVNMVPPESSSTSEMLPAVHELLAFDVVALNTEYDEAVTKRPVATSDTGTTVKPSTRLMRRDGRRMMISFWPSPGSARLSCRPEPAVLRRPIGRRDRWKGIHSREPV